MPLDCFYKGGFSSITVNEAAAMTTNTPVTADCSVNKMAGLKYSILDGENVLLSIPIPTVTVTASHTLHEIQRW